MNFTPEEEEELRRLGKSPVTSQLSSALTPEEQAEIQVAADGEDCRGSAHSALSPCQSLLLVRLGYATHLMKNL